MRLLLPLLASIILLSACNVPDEDKERAAENVQSVAAIKDAYSKITRCENAGLVPQVDMGIDWITVSCDFLSKSPSK